MKHDKVKKIISIASGISFLMLTSCGKKQEESSQPTIVEMAQVKLIPWQQSIQATGTINAIFGAQLKSEVAGRITKIYFRPGQEVKAGDSLLDINPAALLAKYKSVQATEILAKANYQRSRELFQKKFISKADMDNALANLNTAHANSEAVKAELDMAQLKAPFDGTAGINQVNVGDYVSQGQILLNLEQLNPLRVDFTVPEKLSGLINIGDKVSVFGRGDAQLSFDGNVSAVDSAIDSNTRMLAVRATIPNPKRRLLPGSFAQITLSYGAAQQVMVLPQIAVIPDETQGYKVYVVNNQRAKSMPVTIGAHVGDQIIIKSGVKPGDTVVSAGQIKIHDGVFVVDSSAVAIEKNHVK